MAGLLLGGCGSNSSVSSPPPETAAVPATPATTASPSETTIATETTTAPETTTATEETVPPKTVHFCAVGDNIIHSPIYRQAYLDGGGEYDFTAAYDGVAELIAAADLAVVNQETLICDDKYEPSNYPLFNTPTALGDHMIGIGFDVFTLANNHCLDYGEEGVGYTLDYWERTGVPFAGIRRKDEKAYTLGEYNGVTFSFLSYTEALNGFSLPPGSGYVIGNANDRETVLAEVTEAKESSDVCVVALHWGIEYSDEITEAQREYAIALSEAGADVIIGNHPHVMRGIELIETAERDTVCAYSLGNFISAQNHAANMVSGVLELDITFTDRSERVKLTNIRLTPTVTHYDYNYQNLRVIRLADYTPELAAKHGVQKYGDAFSYDYVVALLQKTIDERFLNLS
ncbi:MAG: CapA family protein [Bacteroides sp.]|nr:CapA family protein [Bacteroides sp.]